MSEPKITLIAAGEAPGNLVSEALASLGVAVQQFASTAEWASQFASPHTAGAAARPDKNGFDGEPSGAAAASSPAEPLGWPHCVVLAGPLAQFAASDAAAKIHAVCPGAPIVAICGSATPADAIQAMRDGMTNIVMTDASSGDASGGDAQPIVSAVREAAAEGEQVAKQCYEAKQHQTNLTTLTPAEVQVLDAMLDGMANKQIAQALEIGLRTVELRRSKIMRKMQAKSLAQLVKYVCIAKGIGSYRVMVAQQ